MDTDIQDTHLMDIQAAELLNQLFKGEREWFSEQDQWILTENRKPIVQHLSTLFSEEIPPLLVGEQCSDPTALFLGLMLARFLQASETFHWVQWLCHLSIEELESTLGDYFATGELAYLLADTMNQWNELKEVIENPEISEFIRSACLDARVLSVAQKRIDRGEVTDYFKSLFRRILEGEAEDDRFCTHLVTACSDLWPGECLEEIRESFGLNLVDETHIDIECVLDEFSRGQEYCIEKLQKQLQQHCFWEAPAEHPNLSDENQSSKFERLFQLAEQAAAKAERTLTQCHTGSQRNELCDCGSGRKYKKCCMKKPDPKISPNAILEGSIISYGPLEESDAMKALSEEAKDSLLALYPLLEENPEEVLRKAPEFIAKYPGIPMLYNFLYGAYRNTGHPREAMKLLKETRKLFPNYLFGRAEYALYLLRRGKPEKAYAALDNAGTLSQLYPERKIFHVGEWITFSYAMGLYWIQKGNFSQAKTYQAIMEEISPNSHQITDLQRRIKNKLFLHSLHNLQRGL